MTAGTVIVGYMQSAENPFTFTESLLQLEAFDREGPQRLAGRMPARGASGRLAETRNNICRDFLDRTDCDWLWFVDADMAFPVDIVERLVASAHPTDRPVVGGLCFAQRIVDFDRELHIPISVVYPTIYAWHTESASFANIDDYPDNAMVQCAGTGGACLLIHRSVLERIRGVEGDNWFTPLASKGPDGGMRGFFSEDLSFCLRLNREHIPLFVNTAAKTAHAKPAYLTEATFKAQQSSPRERWVVIPTKDKLGMLRDLIGQLRDQGEADGIVVVDNGSGRTTRNWLGSQPDLVVLSMPEAGIHEMWNAGWSQCPPRADVAFLNNDLRIGPNFLSGLQRALLDDPSLAVVSPNYDNRPESGVQRVFDICANRYDGSGGIAGFAFMVAADVAYQFPEDCKWWFGDNDLVMSVLQQGRGCGVVTSVSVEHIDGGSQTGRWDDPELAPVLAADEAAFCRKWGAVRVPA